MVIFNKNGKLIEKEKVFYGKQGIDSVKGYKYLGIWLECNGKFNRAMNELTKKGRKQFIVFINFPAASHLLIWLNQNF